MKSIKKATFPVITLFFTLMYAIPLLAQNSKLIQNEWVLTKGNLETDSKFQFTSFKSLKQGDDPFEKYTFKENGELYYAYSLPKGTAACGKGMPLDALGKWELVDNTLNIDIKNTYNAAGNHHINFDFSIISITKNKLVLKKIKENKNERNYQSTE